jgi:hypothetical protein
MLLKPGLLGLVGIAAFALAAHAGTRSPTDTQNLGEAAQRSPRGRACSAALESLARDLCADRLPGCTASEMAGLSCDWPDALGPIAYPLSFTFKLTKHEENNLYCYTLQKRAPSAQWHLIKAWIQTKSGERLIDFPLPK